MVASMISRTMPVPSRTPSFGSSQAAMKAPRIPTTRSPMIPRPPPVTIFAARQPATRPTRTTAIKLHRHMGESLLLRGPAAGVGVASQHGLRQTAGHHLHGKAHSSRTTGMRAVAKMRTPQAAARSLYEIGETPPLGYVPERMYAWAIRKERHGPPESSMQVEVVPTWPIGEDEVLLFVMAGGVNYNGVW